jgi:predicted permease
MNDLKYSWRQLCKKPGFIVVAVGTLALGIGANTVVFSVAKAVLLRPLGFAQAEELVWLRMADQKSAGFDGSLSWTEMEEVRTGSSSFEGIGTFGSGPMPWERNGDTETIPTLQVTPNLDEILRIRPALGRLLEDADAVRGAERVVVISHQMWTNHFNGSPEVIGQMIKLDGEARTVVGVLPPALHFPLERSPDLSTGSGPPRGLNNCWLPMGEPRGSDRTSRGARMFLVVGRLKSGMSETAVRAELHALGQRWAVEHPESNRSWSLNLITFRDQILGRTRHSIPLLAVAVAAVLLICCVNLANLMLARSVSRQRELAVCVALGAGRARLIRAVLLESAWLSLLGAVLGVVLAAAALHAIRALGASQVPFIQETKLDGVAIAFTAGLAVLTAFIFGLLPALNQSRIDPAEALRTGGRATGGPRIRAWQHGLLIGQVAIVLGLLASAGLLLESFRRLLMQDLGYEPRQVITMNVSSHGFPSNGDVCRLYREIRARIAALPGVEAVGTISSVPLTRGWSFDERPNVVGNPRPPADRPPVAATFVAFDYFQAMSIPLVEGRYFREDELKDDGYGQIVVLNQSAAALLFPGRSAIGGQFTVGSNPNRILEVIGVVKDTRDERLELAPRPRFYWQYAFGGAQVLVRTARPAEDLVPLLHAIVSQVDRRAKVTAITPMRAIIASTVAERRFLMILLATYAAVALGIAAVGIFGVVAYQVAQRTNEFGVRLALGASPRGVLRLVLFQSGRIVVLGLLGGLALSAATNRLLADQIYGLSPYDPGLMIAASSLLLLVALLASLFPARRAARVDPMTALRTDG